MITFSGLISGIDSASIIEQIVAAESAPASSLQVRQAALNVQKTKVGNLSDLLKALEAAGRNLDTVSELRAAKGSSADAAKVGIAVSSLAQPGNYAMRVTSLAAAQSNVSQAFAAPDPGNAGAGTLDITVGTDPPVQIAWTAAESLYDVASLINDADARVSASVLFDGTSYRLLVTAEDSGAANAVTFAGTGSPLGLDQVGSQLIAAADATYTLNGLAMTSPTNIVNDALSGVTFTLGQTHGAGDPSTNVVIERDPESQREVIGQYVDAYNAVADFLHAELAYTGTTKGADTLFGDGTIRSLQGALRSSLIIGYPSGGESIALGRIGIALDQNGRLTIDDTKLASANSEELEDVFLGEAGGPGLISNLAQTIALYTQTGDGLLEGKTDSLKARIDGYDLQITRIEEHAARVGEQLARQFAALEQTMAVLQAQSNQLLAILGSGTGQ